MSTNKATKGRAKKASDGANKGKKYQSKLSLHPLKFDEAMKLLLKAGVKKNSEQKRESS